MSRPLRSSSLAFTRRLVIVACLALIYFGAARLGFRHAVVAEQVTLVWPPSGIALAALLVLGQKVWPGILLGAFAANASTEMPLLAASSIAVGNTLEGVLGAFLLARAGFRPDIGRLRDALVLVVLAALLSTTISATIGAATLTLGGVQPWQAFDSLWRDWWLGDAVGQLTVAPILLTWFGARRTRFTRAQAIEIAVLGPALVGACLLAFVWPAGSTGTAYPFHYLVVPFVAWAAVRFGPRGSSAAVLIAASIAVASTASGLGPFARRAGEALLLLQLFVAILALTGLLLAAAISERNAIDEALGLTEARLRLALSAARVGSWRWDVRTNEVEWAGELESIHGLAPGTFRGTFDAFLELVHPDDRERVKASIAQALERGGEYEAEFRNEQPDGTHWILGKGCVLRDTAHKPTAVIGVGMDVTERRRLTDELKERAQQLIEQDKRKDEFLATLAHELRNPLAPIAAAVELLKRGKAKNVERLHQILERQTAHLSRLVDDLLDVSRITSGKIQLRMDRVDVSQIISIAVDMSRPMLDERHLAIDVNIPRQPIELCADATRLAQVVANLLSNAARHGKEGGRVWVSVELENETVVVRVRDDGPGMSRELLECVFDLFVQGPGNHNGVGLGIGLPLARMLVELHEGRIEANSEGPGLGSEFTVRLPLHAPASLPPPSEVEEPRADPAPCPRHVLVVDDNVDAAETLAALLELRGHRISIAHDGARAVELARELRLDVILLDLDMPIMTGYEVARVVRGDARLANVRLFAVSGHGAANAESRLRLSAFDAHMVKPVDLQKLFSLIERDAGRG